MSVEMVHQRIFEIDDGDLKDRGGSVVTGTIVNHPSNWGLPPRPGHWPTKEELIKAKEYEIDPREALRALRRELPLAGPKTLGLRLRNY